MSDNEWNAERVLEKWIERNVNPISILSKNAKPLKLYGQGDYIPIEEFEAVVIKAANLVNDLGEEYLCIFERAERELKDARERLAKMERIREIASHAKQRIGKGDFIQPNFLLRQTWAEAVSLS